MSGHVVRSLTALVVVVATATATSAQVRCTASPPWRLPSTHYAAPAFVHWRNDSLTILGTPAFQQPVRPRSGNAEFAGLLVQPGGTVESIGFPRGASDMLHPRARALPGGDLEVMWGESLPESDWIAGYETHRLRVARLRGGRWVSVQVLGDIPNEVSFMRSGASDLLSTSWDVRYLAFNVSDSASWPKLGVASDSGGRWRVRLVESGTMGVMAIDLAEAGGDVLAFYAANSSTPPEGVTMTWQSLWLRRLHRGSWSAPRQIVSDPRGTLSSPRLLHSRGALVAAWVRDADHPALEWARVIGDSAVLSPHRLDEVVMFWPGLPPYTDIVSAIRTDGRASVLRLRADGFDLLAEFPRRNLMPPTITAVRGAPWAFVAEADSAPNSSRVQLVGYDLRCAVAGEGTVVRPR